MDGFKIKLPLLKTAESRPQLAPEAASAINDQEVKFQLAANVFRQAIRLEFPQLFAREQPKPVVAPLAERHASEVSDLAVARAREALDVLNYDQAA